MQTLQFPHNASTRGETWQYAQSEAWEIDSFAVAIMFSCGVRWYKLETANKRIGQKSADSKLKVLWHTS
jgi:hypothetical protein